LRQREVEEEENMNLNANPIPCELPALHVTARAVLYRPHPSR
jgi:hypothetical protein